MTLPLSGCPASYTYVNGRVIGSAIVSQVTGVDNIAACAGHCDANSDCCSFGYSPKERDCNLNSECQSNAPPLPDQVFCVKGNDIVNVNCWRRELMGCISPKTVRFREARKMSRGTSRGPREILRLEGMYNMH